MDKNELLGPCLFSVGQKVKYTDGIRFSTGESVLEIERIENFYDTLYRLWLSNGRWVEEKDVCPVRNGCFIGVSPTHEQYIECLTCLTKSYNPSDIMFRYCEKCKKFNDNET